MKQIIRTHYHWIIALLVLILLTVYGGVINNIASVFLLPVSEELGISRGSCSLGFSVRSLMAILSSMISGVLFLRYGYRKMILVALPVAAVSMMILSASQNLFVLTLGAGLFGLCDGICFTAGMARIIGDWFHRHRGVVLGFVSAFSGLGGSLFCTVLTSWIGRSGWRSAYHFCAVLFLAVAALMLLFVRSRPDQMGLKPYGAGELPTKKSRGVVSETAWPGFSLRELFRRPTFYLMNIGILLYCVLMYLESCVVLPYMQDCGFTAEEAATVQSAMFLIMAVAKFAVGGLCDKIGARWVTVLCIVCGSLGTWLLIGVDTMPEAILAVTMVALCLPAGSITIPLLTVSLFGYRAQDTAMGIFLAMVSMGGVIAPTISNYAYDTFGSYVPVFRVSAILSLCVIGLLLLLYFLADRDRKSWIGKEQVQK